MSGWRRDSCREKVAPGVREGAVVGPGLTDGCVWGVCAERIDLDVLSWCRFESTESLAYAWYVFPVFTVTSECFGMESRPLMQIKRMMAEWLF